MACYHPLKGFVVGFNDNGKKDIVVCSYDVVGVTRHPVHRVYESDLNDFNRKYYYDLKEDGLFIDDFITIPCGQCVGCRLEHSRQWAVRCMLESDYYDENYFLTFTYNEESVPINQYIDDDGEISFSYSLRMKDMQDFIKRLRRHLDYRHQDGFRYFYCGEYGSRSARPHYHMIAFGLHLDPDCLEFYKDTDSGPLYKCKFLSDIWKHGYVIVGGVSFESCAYVSRYIMKKHKGEASSFYDKFNIVPEFIRMSRNPGIGRRYFDDNFEDIYPNDILVLPGGQLSKPPRYFDTLMNQIDEDLMDELKVKRLEYAEAMQRYKDSLSDRDYLMQLEHAENNKSAQLNKLVRTLE